MPRYFAVCEKKVTTYSKRSAPWYTLYQAGSVTYLTPQAIKDAYYSSHYLTVFQSEAAAMDYAKLQSTYTNNDMDFVSPPVVEIDCQQFHFERVSLTSAQETDLLRIKMVCVGNQFSDNLRYFTPADMDVMPARVLEHTPRFEPDAIVGASVGLFLGVLVNSLQAANEYEHTAIAFLLATGMGMGAGLVFKKTKEAHKPEETYNEVAYLPSLARR